MSRTQYKRNMATGASTADCAVLLADARKTRRHALIAIRPVVLAVNKLDLVGCYRALFDHVAGS
jgi:sulfate adenylyltransferase subunit 1 (EFTu-like GTPase family)